MYVKRQRWNLNEQIMVFTCLYVLYKEMQKLIGNYFADLHHFPSFRSIGNSSMHRLLYSFCFAICRQCTSTEKTTFRGKIFGETRDLLVFGHESLKLRGICASEFVNLRSPFEELEGRHGRNTTSRSDILAIVHVHFDKGDVGVFRCHLLENWPNHLTRSGGVERKKKR